MALDDSVPTSEDPSISFEAYLDLVNPASGAGTNLADTLASDVTVVEADPISATSEGDGDSSTWLLLVGAIVILAVGTGVVMMTRQRKTRSA